MHDKLQTILKRLGYYNGKIDGVYGPETIRAYNNFKADKKNVQGFDDFIRDADRLLGVPLNARALAFDIDPTTDKNTYYTEQDLTDKELNALRNVTRNALKNNRTRIDYPDYNLNEQLPVLDPQSNVSTSTLFKNVKNPLFNLKSFIGRGNINIIGKDTIVSDTYDFNDAKDNGLESVHDLMYGRFRPFSSSYNTLRGLGTAFGSSDGNGAPIIINTSQFKKQFGGPVDWQSALQSYNPDLYNTSQTAFGQYNQAFQPPVEPSKPKQSFWAERNRKRWEKYQEDLKAYNQKKSLYDQSQQLAPMIGPMNALYQGQQGYMNYLKQPKEDLTEDTGFYGYQYGGGIHINPEHKGEFTEYAQNKGMGVQEAAHWVMAHSDDPHLRRQANFAINAAGWHHNMKEGGYMFNEIPHMKEGGIPQRYRNMGFTHVGQKKEGDGKHKWKVLAKKGDKYKVVQGGYRGMEDYTQHHNEQRRNRFWERMGGKNSAKAKDPFSPLYWHKKLGTWQDGGVIFDNYKYAIGNYPYVMQEGGAMENQMGGPVNTTGYTPGFETMNNPYNIIPSNNLTMKNTPFPVLGIPNMGSARVMMPGENHYFPNAEYVTEIPMRFQEGGEVQKPSEPIPIQTEKGEFIGTQTGDIFPVKAKKLHKHMKKEDVTDILPEGNFIFSRDPKMTLYKNKKFKGIDLNEIVLGYTPIEYSETESTNPPKEIKFIDFMNANKFTPADLARSLKSKYSITDKNDAYSALANEQNRMSRKPYLEIIKGLNDIKKKKTPQKFQYGGSVGYYGYGGPINHYQTGSYTGVIPDGNYPNGVLVNSPEGNYDNPLLDPNIYNRDVGFVNDYNQNVEPVTQQNTVPAQGVYDIRRYQNPNYVQQQFANTPQEDIWYGINEAAKRAMQEAKMQEANKNAFNIPYSSVSESAFSKKGDKYEYILGNDGKYKFRLKGGKDWKEINAAGAEELDRRIQSGYYDNITESDMAKPKGGGKKQTKKPLDIGPSLLQSYKVTDSWRMPSSSPSDAQIMSNYWNSVGLMGAGLGAGALGSLGARAIASRVAPAVWETIPSNIPRLAQGAKQVIDITPKVLRLPSPGLPSPGLASPSLMSRMAVTGYGYGGPVNLFQYGGNNSSSELMSNVNDAMANQPYPREQFDVTQSLPGRDAGISYSQQPLQINNDPTAFFTNNENYFYQNNANKTFSDRNDPYEYKYNSETGTFLTRKKGNSTWKDINPKGSEVLADRIQKGYYSNITKEDLKKPTPVKKTAKPAQTPPSSQNNKYIDQRNIYQPVDSTRVNTMNPIYSDPNAQYLSSGPTYYNYTTPLGQNGSAPPIGAALPYVDRVAHDPNGMYQFGGGIGINPGINSMAKGVFSSMMNNLANGNYGNQNQYGPPQGNAYTSSLMNGAFIGGASPMMMNNFQNTLKKKFYNIGNGQNANSYQTLNYQPNGSYQIGGIIKGVADAGMGIYNSWKANKLRKQTERDLEKNKKDTQDYINKGLMSNLGTTFANYATQDPAYTYANYSPQMASTNYAYDTVGNNLGYQQSAAGNAASGAVNTFMQNAAKMGLSPERAAAYAAKMSANAVNAGNNTALNFAQQQNNNILGKNQALNAYRDAITKDQQMGHNLVRQNINALNNGLFSGMNQGAQNYWNSTVKNNQNTLAGMMAARNQNANFNAANNYMIANSLGNLANSSINYYNSRNSNNISAPPYSPPTYTASDGQSYLIYDPTLDSNPNAGHDSGNV